MSNKRAPLTDLPAFLVLLAIFGALVAAGWLLGIDWLIGLGSIWFFLFLLALYGATWQRLQRRREVRENMRRILQERENARREEG
jgi:hypothetical protein